MNDFFPGEGRKKITSLFNNQQRYNRSGSITTATNDKDDPLRKSRIVNLPNYKKDTLDGRLDFVVVFQSIEIQRLSVQIQSLRVRLADRQRQIFNYKNYEVQIKELNERCYEYQSDKINYQQQFAMLRQSLSQSQHQTEEWRQKCSSFEDALREQEEIVFSLKENLIIERKQREQLEEGRLMLESSIKQKEKQYSRHLKDMQKSTQFKRTELTKNEEHLNNLLKKYHEEVNSLQKQNLNLRNLYEKIEQQSQDLERRYQELQEELYRGNELIKEKDFQIDTVEHEGRERIQMLQNRYEEEYNIKCRRLEECEQEVNEWKGEVDKLENQHQKYQLKIAEFSQQCERYETLLNEAGDQIDRLNTIIKDKIKYLQAWQGRYNELQENYNKTEQSVNMQNQKLASDQEEIMRLSQALKLKTEQFDKMERSREQEVRSIKDKLQEIEVNRQEIAAIRREKQAERDDQRRRELENIQMKEQLNRRIVEGNKLFEDLNRAEVQIKQLKQQISNHETSLRIKEEELNKVKNDMSSVDVRIEKMQNQKRMLEQDVMKIKALEQRIRHEESKKNEYLNESKRLGHRLRDTERQLSQTKRQNQDLQLDLQKFEKYTEQLMSRVTELQSKLHLLQQLKMQISSLYQKNSNNEMQLGKLQEIINKKVAEVLAFKEKIYLFEKYIKEFKVREENFKDQITYYQKLEGELKQQKIKYEALEDKTDQLEIDLSGAMGEIETLSKENGSLQRVIDINAHELQRSERLLTEAKQEIQNQKERQKELIFRLKDIEKKIKQSENQVQKERDKLAKEKQEIQKMFEKKSQEFELELRSYQSSKETLLSQRQKELKQSEASRVELTEDNNSLRILLKKYEDQKQKIAKMSKQLQKKIASLEHQIERMGESGSEAKKQIQISFKNNEKLNLMMKQTEEQLRQQMERFNELLTTKQRLVADIADKERCITSKEQDNSHLLRENQLFQKEITTLQDELQAQQEKNLEMCGELIKVKYESEGVIEQYKSLKARLSNMQKLFLQLKTQLGRSIQLSSSIDEQKKQIEKKYSEYQEKLSLELDRLEEQQFKAAEEIIRLDTLNRILQIEVGEYKERESAVFSIVKETSMLKERKEVSPYKDAPVKDKSSPELKLYDRPVRQSRRTQISQSRIQKQMKESQQLLKSSIFGDATPTKKSRCGTTRFQDDLAENSQCERRDSGKGDNPLLKSSKKCVYFQNLVFKAN